MINAPRQETANATLHAISAVANNASPAAQPVAILAAAVLFIEGKGLDLQDTMVLVKNLINSHDTHLGTDFEAIRMYVENDL
jgi:anthranilate phosphoribosyltransferase